MVRRTIDDLYPSMPWDELDAVVFDVGNVLLSFNPQGILEELLPDDKALYPVLTEKIFRSPYWMMMDHGDATLTEAADAMVGNDTRYEKQIRHVMTHWIEMKHVLDEGLQALDACKAHGKRVFVLSNYGSDAFEHVYHKYDFFKRFDGMMISARVHLLKPDPDIFHLAAETFGLDPERTLFIDDVPANIEGALHAGWQGFCHLRQGKLREFMRLP